MFELTIILVCLAANAILAGSETAFIALNKQSLRTLVKQGDEKAALLLHLRENPERTLAVIQIGITFLGAFAAAIGGAGAEESISPWLQQKGFGEKLSELLAIFLVVIPLTYASVVLGELVPKTLALRRSHFIASSTAPWINLSSRLLNPIVSLFEWSTKKIIDLFPKRHTAADEIEESAPTLDEVVSPQNKQYIMNMVEVERTHVKDIYLPWNEVIFVKESFTMEEVEKTVITSAHTRLPIVKGENVIGILNAKEFLAYEKTGSTNWLSLSRNVVSVQESTMILTALRLLQENRSHMAIVYAGSAKKGIVTMEAIFEEIIGDIYDEDDDGTLKKILTRGYRR